MKAILPDQIKELLRLGGVDPDKVSECIVTCRSDEMPRIEVGLDPHAEPIELEVIVREKPKS